MMAVHLARRTSTRRMLTGHQHSGPSHTLPWMFIYHTESLSIWWHLHLKLVLCTLCRLGCPSVDIVGSFLPSLRIPGSQTNLHWLRNAFSSVCTMTQLSLLDCDLAPEGFHVVEAEQANVSEQRLKGIAPILLIRQALLDLEQSTT